MGRVIDLAEARARRRARRAARPGAQLAELERLIARLTPLVRARGASKGRALQTELLAAVGAVATGLYAEASARLERLAARLEGPDGEPPTGDPTGKPARRSR